MDQHLQLTLHNLVNIPPELKTSPGSTMMYTVEIHCDTGSCPTVAGSFLKNEINETHGHYEVFWEDGANQTQSATTTHIPAPDSVKEWKVSSHARSIDFLVSVFETNQVSGRRRQLGTSTPVSIDPQYVLRRKIVTKVLGTSTGQVGLSFCVSPHDTAGYKARLEEFLKANNPAGLALVPSVISSVSEIETFNKVFKKYGKEDYPRRVKLFFEMYGPEHLAAIPSTMKEWENREEELLRHLVLENGPEPNDIDLKLRLLAFIEKYNIADLDLEALLEAHRSDPSVLFSSLVSKHGPEPDPRTYLYPAVYYAEPGAEPVPVPAPQPVVSDPPKQAEPVSTASMPVPPSATTSTSRTPTPVPVAAVTKAQESFTQPPASKIEPPPASKYPPFEQTSTPAPSQHQQVASHMETDGDLWTSFCNKLRQASIPPAEIYYLNETSFMTLVNELGFERSQHGRLSAEWQQRVKGALKQVYLSNDDPQYEGVKRDVLSLSGMQALNVQVMGVMSIKNTEHESSFAMRLASAKAHATEKMIYVGEFNELVSFATTGFSPTPNQGNAILIKKKPFSNIRKPTTLSLLVCDVIVGHPLVSVMDPATNPQPDFFQTYDSCITRINTDDQGVLVYQPQQVLAKYLVHCSVNPTITACPYHPTRQVEYYVPDENAFVCSQCVVLGQFRNREVLGIDDAALQARSHLNEMAREVKGLRDDLSTQEKEVERALLQLSNSEQWQAAKRQAEAIRREAEIRASEILREAERQQEEQQSSLTQTKTMLTDVLREVEAVSDNVQKGVDVGATEAIQVLCQLRDARSLEVIKERVGVSRQATRSASGGSGALPFAASAAAPAAVPQRHGANLSRTASMHSLHQTEFENPPQPPQAAVSKEDQPAAGGDLFSKFQALKGTTVGPYQHNTPTPRDPSTLFGGHQRMAPAFASTSLQRVRHEAPQLSNVSNVREEEAKHSKEQMTKGWAAYRAGNKALAQQLWSDVFERNSTNAVGFRARAYLAEAIERDYQTASVWYEKALQVDPQDTMTLFNYAVLLESVLGKKREALELFDAAFRLGDHTAGRRAQLLRQQGI